MNRKLITSLAIMAGLAMSFVASTELAAQCCNQRGRIFQRVTLRGNFFRNRCCTNPCATPVADCGCAPVAETQVVATPVVATPVVANCNTCCRTRCCKTRTRCCKPTCNTGCCNQRVALIPRLTGYVSTRGASCGSGCATPVASCGCQPTTCCKTRCCKTRCRKVRCCKPRCRKVRCCNRTRGCCGCASGCSPAADSPSADGVEPTPAKGSEPPKPNGNDT